MNRAGVPLREGKLLPKGVAAVYLLECGEGQYVGSSGCVRGRLLRHLRELKQNKHHNRRLQTAWNKQEGIDFKFSLLEETSKDCLVSIENQWIIAVKPNLNIYPTARYQGPLPAVPESRKQKLSEHMKARPEQWVKPISRRKTFKEKNHLRTLARGRVKTRGLAHTDESKKLIARARVDYFKRLHQRCETLIRLICPSIGLPPYESKVGKALEAIRNSRKISKARMPYTESTIRRMERGEDRLLIRKLKRYSSGLNLKFTEFLVVLAAQLENQKCQ